MMKQIIKKILKEEITRKEKLRSLVDEMGYDEASKFVGGVDNLIKILFDGNVNEYYTQRVREIILFQTEIQDPCNFDDAEEFADFCIGQGMELFFGSNTDWEHEDWKEEDFKEQEVDMSVQNEIEHNLTIELYDLLIELYNEFDLEEC